MAFVANLFNAHPALPLDEETEGDEEEDVYVETREEKSKIPLLFMGLEGSCLPIFKQRLLNILQNKFPL